MNRPARVALTLVILAAFGVGLARLYAARSGGNAATPAAPAASAAIAALQLAAADLITVHPEPLLRGVPVSGSVRAVRSAFVKAKVAGELLALTPREGDAVRAGQVIGRIDTQEAELRLRQAEQNAEAARAQADIARRQLDNNQALVAQGFVSPTTLETAQANDRAARASLAAAQTAVKLARKSRSDAELRAPIDGLISQRLAQPGERVAIDARLVEVVDLAQLELEAALPPEDAGAVRVGMTARLQVEGLAEPVAARVARINPGTQAGTRAVTIYLALQPGPAQRDGLRVGLYARGSIELERSEHLALPPEAVRLDEPQPYVIVLVTSPAGAQLHHRAVQTGQRSQDAQGRERLEVRAGLQPGEQVLDGRLGSVRDGTPAKLAAPAAGTSASAAAAIAAQAASR